MTSHANSFQNPAASLPVVVGLASAEMTLAFLFLKAAE